MADALAVIIIIASIVLLTAVTMLIRKLINKGVDAAFDAARNRRIDREEKINPPAQTNLADKFKNN